MTSRPTSRAGSVATNRPISRAGSVASRPTSRAGSVVSRQSSVGTSRTGRTSRTGKTGRSKSPGRRKRRRRKTKAATPADLVEACVNRDVEGVQRIVAAGRVGVDERPKSGTAAIIEAARVGDVRIVSLLLNAGADKNARDALGNSGLMWAAGHGHVDVVRTLIDAGADLGPNFQGHTILVRCARFGRSICARLILQELETELQRRWTAPDAVLGLDGQTILEQARAACRYGKSVEEVVEIAENAATAAPNFQEATFDDVQPMAEDLHAWVCRIHVALMTAAYWKHPVMVHLVRRFREDQPVWEDPVTTAKEEADSFAAAARKAARKAAVARAAAEAAEAAAAAAAAEARAEAEDRDRQKLMATWRVVTRMQAVARGKAARVAISWRRRHRAIVLINELLSKHAPRRAGKASLYARKYEMRGKSVMDLLHDVRKQFNLIPLTPEQVAAEAARMAAAAAARKRAEAAEKRAAELRLIALTPG